jgi:hypothetical protein
LALLEFKKHHQRGQNMNHKTVWHIATDLMMVSNVKTAAAQHQLNFVAVPNLAKLPSEQLPAEVAVVLVDLQLPGLDFARLQTVLATNSNPQLLVCLYAQHVDEEALARGEALGVGQVMTRGQVHRDMQRVFAAIAS